jgi:hypothetical protein
LFQILFYFKILIQNIEKHQLSDLSIETPQTPALSGAHPINAYKTYFTIIKCGKRPIISLY